MISNAYLTAIGTANPQFQYQQAELAHWMSQRLNPKDDGLERKLRVLYHKTKIENRYSVLPDFHKSYQEVRLFHAENFEPRVQERMKVYQEEALPLAKSAILDALTDVESVQDVTHLITVSCTGMSAPGIELQLKEQLGFSDKLETHAVNFVGCYAFFPALKMARSFCQANPKAKVLIVAVELCTLHFQNQESEDHLLSNSLFADGAAACLIEGQNTNAKLKLKIEKTAQFLFPKGKSDMAWSIDESGFLMRLTSYVPDLVNHGIGRLVQRLTADMQNEEIEQWAIHPGGRKILEACQKELNLTDEEMESSYRVLAKFGNMSAPTILFVLKDLWSNPISNAIILACGFGPGLTLDGALFKWEVDA